MKQHEFCRYVGTEPTCIPPLGARLGSPVTAAEAKATGPDRYGTFAYRRTAYRTGGHFGRWATGCDAPNGAARSASRASASLPPAATRNAERTRLTIPRWVTALALLGAIACTPAERQRQACLVAADAHKVARAHELCAGLHWTDCPEERRELIRAEHRERMRACPY